MASHTGICDASSNTTMSNVASGGRYCATDSGLMRKHGFRRPDTERVSASSLRIGFCLAFLAHSRLIVPSSHPSGQSPSRPSGSAAARRARITCLASSAYSASSRLNSAICSSRRSPAKEASVVSARSISFRVRASTERSKTSSAWFGERSPPSRAMANAPPASFLSASAEARYRMTPRDSGIASAAASSSAAKALLKPLSPYP